MILFVTNWTIEQLSAVISIATPIILLVWFYYSQRQALSKNYYQEINGIYAGFTEPVSKTQDKKGINSGIIMHIRDTDEKGFFKGEFDFAETKTEIENDRLIFTKLRDGTHTFLGKLDFELYKNKTSFH